MKVVTRICIHETILSVKIVRVRPSWDAAPVSGTKTKASRFETETIKRCWIRLTMEWLMRSDCHDREVHGKRGNIGDMKI